ncbi:rhodanese-like domain-containing protein [Cochleicola gelatinilyticus]|nr:rhodanese-like domain-containing protein [Cochleicola gelatinilyticus]
MKKSLLIIFVALLALYSCQQKSSAVTKMTPTEVNNSFYTSEDAQLIDVRTSQEFTVSHLKDAQNICVTNDDFEEKVKNLDKNKPVYLYCKKGGRSAKAAEILADMGFKEIYDLQGGITNWEESGFETEN